MNREIIFNIATFKPTTDWELGQAILEFVTNFDTRLIPQFMKRLYDKNYVDFVSINECEQDWASMVVARGKDKKNKDFYYYSESYRHFYLKRKNVIKYNFEFRHTFRDRRGNLREGVLKFSAQYHKAINWTLNQPKNNYVIMAIILKMM